MKKYWNKFIDDTAPSILGMLILITVFMLGFGACIWSIKWVVSLLVG